MRRVMLYPVVLLIHSWLRWLVVLVGVFVVIRAFLAKKQEKPYEPLDNLLSVTFVAALDSQVLLGLLLYVFLSPITSTAFQNMGAAMRTSPLRFFLIEHAFSMLLAVGFAHAARVRARKKTEAKDKHRETSLFFAISLGCILAGIPWPFLPYARPLARVSSTIEVSPNPTQAELEPSRLLFQDRCSPCHGPMGRGDGPAGRNLIPAPRDFQDPQWQATTSDQAIETIIRKGGLPLQKSPLMPANPDFDDATIHNLRAYIRSLKR